MLSQAVRHGRRIVFDWRFEDVRGREHVAAVICDVEPGESATVDNPGLAPQAEVLQVRAMMFDGLPRRKFRSWTAAVDAVFCGMLDFERLERAAVEHIIHG